MSKKNATNAPTKPDHISFELRSFTNAEIEKILERSNNFRDLRPSWVEHHLSAMRNGDWDWGNGETIGFDANNRLVNGQHRLTALSRYQEETGHTAWLWCAMGIQPSSAMTMDLAKSRTTPQYLKHMGVPYYQQAAMIARALATGRLPGMDEKPIYLWQMHRTEWDEASKARLAVTVSTQSVVNAYKRNKDFVDFWSPTACRLSDAGISRPATIMTTLACIATLFPEDATKFMELLISGENLSRTSPIYQLRARCLRDAASNGKHIVHNMVVAIVTKAFMAWHRGESMSVLRVKLGGAHADKFPDVRELLED